MVTFSMCAAKVMGFFKKHLSSNTTCSNNISPKDNNSNDKQLNCAHPIRPGDFIAPMVVQVPRMQHRPPSSIRAPRSRSKQEQALRQHRKDQEQAGRQYPVAIPISRDGEELYDDYKNSLSRPLHPHNSTAIWAPPNLTITNDGQACRSYSVSQLGRLSPSTVSTGSSSGGESPSLHPRCYTVSSASPSAHFKKHSNSRRYPKATIQTASNLVQTSPAPTDSPPPYSRVHLPSEMPPAYSVLPCRDSTSPSTTLSLPADTASPPVISNVDLISLEAGGQNCSV